MATVDASILIIPETTDRFYSSGLCGFLDYHVGQFPEAP